MIHTHRALPELFGELASGACRFELLEEQTDSRAYAVGDYLAVNEVSGGKHEIAAAYTGNCRLFKITHIRDDPTKLAPGIIALGLRLVPLSFDDVCESNG